ncbi:MAG: glycerophosphodiester phosphodiesterase [Sphaerochaeta sp.]|jgi:glycerophosphoryl diester phosphodiesterase|nr:glycerophosphodiester phosphodiesterase [Sphaerochaeta sp.]MDX9915082.1 glycerophosphodiester phosphodiesterase [Sphaerochaeta sp.]
MGEGRNPLVTAHSGCEGSKKNSLASVMAGLQANADIVEIDIRSSRDGVPILHHDPSLQGTGEPPIVLSDHTYTEIVAYAHRTGVELTSLESVMELVSERDRILNLDMKDTGSVGYIKRLVEVNGLKDSIIISGCGYDRAKEVIDSLVGVQVLLNAYHDPLIVDAGQYTAFVHTLCQQVIEVGSCGINIEYTMSSEQLVLHAKKRFIPVSVWTVDDERDMQQMASHGVFSITTHHPRRLRQLLD